MSTISSIEKEHSIVHSPIASDSPISILNAEHNWVKPEQTAQIPPKILVKPVYADINSFEIIVTVISRVAGKTFVNSRCWLAERHRATTGIPFVYCLKVVGVAPVLCLAVVDMQGQTPGALTTSRQLEPERPILSAVSHFSTRSKNN